MAKKSTAITPATPDITSLSVTVETAITGLESIDVGLVIFDNQGFDSTAVLYEDIKRRKEALDEATKPVVDSVKQLKAAVDGMLKKFSARYDKIEESFKSAMRAHLDSLTDEDEKPAFGRLQGGQWMVEVSDEAALKEHIISKPELHYLLEVSPSKLKSLASAQTTAFNMPGAKAKQGMSLFINTKGME